MSTTSTKSSNTSSSEDDNTNELRRGPWTMEEDTILIRYIACHGEGRWNLLAKRSGLRRTGKSCRLRWLNYLKPDVKRGNLAPEEQLLILDLHSKWGNRWSKIAQYLPGRTDNEIKNYWRTRVQKQAKHLKIDAESAAFQDIIRRFWMPRLIQKIEGSSSASAAPIIVQNTLVPMPLDTNYQAQHNSPPQQNILRHENPLNMPGSSMNLEQCSDCESMNMSQISQFSEYTNSPFQQMVSNINNDQTTTNNNNNNNNNTFLEGCTYDMDVFSSHTSVSQAKGLENPVGVCHVEGGDWADNDFFASLWNMDELWQHKS